MKSPDELVKENTADLCNAYNFTQSQEVKQELVRRNAFTDREWDLIERKSVGIGMGEIAIICAWGAPTKINRTISRYGERKQWVYRRGYSAQYVYTENGTVTSVQG